MRGALLFELHRNICKCPYQSYQRHHPDPCRANGRFYSGSFRFGHFYTKHECTDDNLDIDFHYCPLVKAWQKQGCSYEEIQTLCDQAMCGDRGIAESFGCHLELPKTIARGDDICEIHFVRDEK